MIRLERPRSTAKRDGVTNGRRAETDVPSDGRLPETELVWVKRITFEVTSKRFGSIGIVEGAASVFGRKNAAPDEPWNPGAPMAIPPVSKPLNAPTGVTE